MGAMTDALAAVETALLAAGVTTIYKEFSTAAPATVAHVVLSVDASPLDREDVDNFGGTMEVTAEWFSPGTASDGQAEFLTAMDAWDAIIVALCGLDGTVTAIDPGGNITRNEESADLAHWYTATATITMMRKEPPTP